MSHKQRRTHPIIQELRHQTTQGQVSRREFLRCATLLGLSLGAATTLIGCGANPPESPAGPPPLVKRGGTLRLGTVIPAIDHPARLSLIDGSNVVRQVAEYLTETGPDNITRPWLLERWEADDEVKTWTLFLRQGINFHNGDPLTADDVIFNFQQWLDPAVDSSMRSLLSYLNPTDIEKVDEYTIRLHLSNAQIGVPEHLFHYPALIMPRRFEGDFIKQPIGTGPFTLTGYTANKMARFTSYPNYWQRGPDGRPLPYLDELVFFDMGPDERVAALKRGEIDTMWQPRSEDWNELRTHPELNTARTRTAQTLVLRMRADVAPWHDVRVRKALKLCQDRAKILDLTVFGEGDLAIDAHVAPVHPAYCEKPIPKYDPAQSRALLAEAGYPEGLKVVLTTKTDMEEPSLTRVLQKLAAPGGFDIEARFLEPSVYWEQWTEFDLGITGWAHRPLDTMTLALGYTADESGKPGVWNETHWVDAEFNQLLREAERTLDVTARRAIMCQIEDIMQERGPIGISYWRHGWSIAHTAFRNIQAHPTEVANFRDVWKDS